MTVSTTDNVKVYTGNAVTTAFSFPYLFYSNSHLRVTLDGVLKTITTHYTVTGAENPAGGTVTFLTAPGTGVEVIIERVVPITQETDLENFDGNPADVTEKQFDLLAMADQQLTENLERAILAPLGTTLTTNAISGDITATAKVMTLSTSGPSVVELADLDTDLDTVFTSLASGDILKYDGTNWVNDQTVDTIASGAIALAKIVNGTAGNVLAYNASGVLDVVATGNSGQVLMSNGAGAAPTMQTLTSGLVPLASSAPSAATEVDFGSTYFTTTYKHYLIFYDVTGTAANYLDGRFLVGGTVQDASNYSYHLMIPDSTAATYSGYRSAADSRMSLAKTENGERCIGIIHISGMNASGKPGASSFGATCTGSGTINSKGAGFYTSAITADGFRVLAGSGTITGNIHLFGVKHA